MEIDFSDALSNLEGMIESFITSIPNIIVALVVFIIFYLLGWLTRFVVRRLSKRYRRSFNLGVVMGRISQWMVILIGFLIAMVIVFPNFTPAQLIQLLGITSVAAGFAFRNILENFLAGILLLLSEPFKIGDQIIIEDFEGTVEEIETRATMIRTYDGRRVVIPNGDLFTKVVTVNTAFEKRRLEYDFQIGYDDDISKAKELILEAIREAKDVLPGPPPDVLVMEFGEAGVVLRARWWISPPLRSDALDTRDTVLANIKEKLLTHGIDLPFPTQQILFPNQTNNDKSRPSGL